MLGLYVHIPFCKSRCGYCDFCSTSAYDDKLMDRYLAALRSQVADFFSDKVNKTLVDTVYFGGGTPSVFGGKRIAILLQDMKKRILLKDAEITVEVNPESCDKALCKQLRKAGVNRISMGVQSAVDSELAEIGRLHRFQEAEAAVALIRKYVGDNINLDLIYGLPGQTMESWKISLEQIMRLNPAHISAYGLKLEPGCGMYGKNIPLPDEDMQADMYLYAVDMLEKNGYQQYEISNFAKDGRISRHNSKYWDLSEYLGLGASAHSLYRGRRFNFISDIVQFVAREEQGESVLEEQEDVALTVAQRKGEYIMLMLRTTAGIDGESFYRTFHSEFTPFAQRMQKYIAGGYAKQDGNRYFLTPTGFLISNTIICDVMGDV